MSIFRNLYISLLEQYMEDKELNRGKQVEFYSAKAHAWFNTRLEYDKSLLVLSAGAIGLLITLLTTIGVHSLTELLVFIASIICFIVCLISLLVIFSRNSTYLENLISGKSDSDPFLKALDKVSIFSFILGVILASIISFSIAANEFITKEIEMTTKNDNPSKKAIINDSFQGAHAINPSSTEMSKKSFEGAGNVAPPTQETGSTESGSSTTSQSETSTSSESNSSSNK